MHDRLIELIDKACYQEAFDAVFSSIDEVLDMPKGKEYMANYLLENGVIVPPVKEGQILYIIEAGIIIEAKVIEYKYCSNSNNGVHWHIIFEELFAMSEAHIGDSVFYSREEAEQTLKGGAE